MADNKISNLPIAPTVTDDDLLVIVADVAIVPETKQITVGNFKLAISGSSSYAPADEGVTNGNSHNHIGGDGSAITEGAISLSDVTTGNSGSSMHGFAIKVSTTAGQKLITTGSAQKYIDDDTGFSVIIGDGNTAPIPTGIKGDIEIPFDCELESWTMLLTGISGSSSGSIVLDVWKGSYVNYPVTSASSISGSATKPTVIGASKAQDTTLVNWNKTLTKGDILTFAVEACSGSSIKQATLAFKARKTATS